MEEETQAKLVGFIYGFVISVSFDFLVDLIEVFINLVFFGAPIVAALLFPKLFPQSYKNANQFSYLGLFLGVLIMAGTVISRDQGFGAVAAILLVILSLFYITGYAIVIVLIHKLITHPDNKSED